MFNSFDNDGYYSNNYSNQISFFEECLRSLDANGLWTNETYPGMNAENFVNIVGFQLNMEALHTICAPTYHSMVPQIGVFQLMSMTLLSDIKFVSNSTSVIEDEVVPFLESGGVNCRSGNICSSPFIQQLFRDHALYFLLGAFLFTCLGVFLVIIKFFTPSFILKGRTAVVKFFSKLCPCFGNNAVVEKEYNEEQITFDEVAEEKKNVWDIIHPILKVPNVDDVEADNTDSIINYAAKEAVGMELPPILMHRLRKVYPSSGSSPPKVALEGLDLHVPKGQVLGLLGKNGSGKTTALKILSASHESTGGVALVAGFDVNAEKGKVFEQLGNCPQFDVVWPFLSVKHHIEFFARLKGLPGNHVRQAAHTIAKAVGLGASDVYNRSAGALSGGMRRRLSIAMSFVGAPNVLLLDEPTTGLDPSTRNEIWGLVSSFATKERAMIITTHMMIEADTLCNRIAIISKGNLSVVATQQYLKDNYGSGYSLQLNLVRSSQAHQDQAMAFVNKYLHEDAILDTKQAKTLHVFLPKDINLEKVFSALYSPQRSSEGGINQFLLSQSSLEDVFISLGK